MAAAHDAANRVDGGRDVAHRCFITLPSLC
jgi:hypothetical protein